MAIASLVANIAIVVTGGAVRLTGSGLGCPTWPRCTDDSFVARSELGTHGLIEYGNRLLTFVLVAVAVATLAVVWRHRPIRPQARTLAVLLFLGIPAQAVLGGITVLTDLNPWIVAGHLMLSMALIALSVLLLLAVRGNAFPSSPVVAGLPSAAVSLAWLVYLLVWAVLYAGTVVTGSGPHAGDADAPRNGLDPAAMSQLHADLVLLLLGLTVGLVLLLRAVSAPAAAARAAHWLLGVELAQGLVGAVQYATDLPLLLVGLHLLGAAVLVAVATWALASVRMLAAPHGT
jgi:cytochrome c oxidase assembly protein subunit 15